MTQSKWGNEFGGFLGEFDGYDPNIPKTGITRYYQTRPSNSNKLNILLLGDSILNFTVCNFIRNKFKDKANINRIQHPFPEYYIEEYLDNFWNYENWNYDIVFYMSGLHGFPPRQNNEQSIKGINNIITKFKSKNIKLIWGNSTHIPEGFKPSKTATQEGPSNKSVIYNNIIIERNNILKNILLENNIPLLDLYDLTKDLPHKSNKDVHFIKEADYVIAQHIANILMKYI